MTQEELIGAIETMTVLELSELVKAMEDRFGVSAAAPVAAAAAAPAAAEAAVEEEQTEFDVMLTEIGSQKIKVIKAVREMTTLGLREAKAAVDEAPSAILKAVSKEDAEAGKKKLEEVGATAEIK